MKFGKLTVLEKVRKNKEGRWFYRCVCDCGNEVERPMNRLNDSSSCFKGECASERYRSHGMRGTRVYRIWKGMKSRCKNKSDKDFSKYSKLGICDRWLVFEHFLLDMGEPPTSKHQIDRIDNKSGYRKDNCRWATVSEQARNRSTSKAWFADGVEYETVREVAEHYGVKPPVAHRWFAGYNSRGKRYPPKEGFIFKEKY